MAKFGIPYMGSKDKIASSLALNFPKKKHFYDLFGGGFSMTHYMLINRSKDYETFHYNEIVPSTVELVRKAIAGDYSYDRFMPEWISREKFLKRLDDAYVRICWSFGNDQKNYMFSPQIEPYKKSMHQAVVFGDFDDLAAKTFRFSRWPSKVSSFYQRRLYLRQLIEHYRKTRIPKHLHKYLNVKQLKQLERLQSLQQLEQLLRLEQLQQLEQLEQLQRLQQLEQLQRLQGIKGEYRNLSLTALDYREVEIKPDSLVYCDIPYKDTGSYLGSFHHKDFYDWASSRDFPVYISEYNISDPRFKLVYQVDKKAMFKNENPKKKTMSENLYWNWVL